jgi:hypothetical protein
MKEIKIGETGLRELTKLEEGHDTVGGHTERPKHERASDIAKNAKRRQEHYEKLATRTLEEVGRAYVALIDSFLVPRTVKIKTNQPKGKKMKKQKLAAEIANREGGKSQGKIHDHLQGLTRLEEIGGEEMFLIDIEASDSLSAIFAGAQKHYAKLQRAYDKVKQKMPYPNRKEFLADYRAKQAAKAPNKRKPVRKGGGR